MLTLSTSPGPLDRPPQLSFSEAAENGRVSGPKAAENGRKLAGRKAASGTGLRPISRCRFSKKSEKRQGRGGVLFCLGSTAQGARMVVFRKHRRLRCWPPRSSRYERYFRTTLDS